MARWYDGHPRLVGGDFIHPTPQGAAIVAQLLVKDLMTGYEQYLERHHEVHAAGVLPVVAAPVSVAAPVQAAAPKGKPSAMGPPAEVPAPPDAPKQETTPQPVAVPVQQGTPPTPQPAVPKVEE